MIQSEDAVESQSCPMPPEAAAAYAKVGSAATVTCPGRDRLDMTARQGVLLNEGIQ